MKDRLTLCLVVCALLLSNFGAGGLSRADEDKNVARDDCDLLIFKTGSDLLVGTALIDKVLIKSKNLPNPSQYKKSEIAYIHFKQEPVQPDDFIQLVNGSSRSGTILNLDPVKFREAGSKQVHEIPRKTILSIMFRCSIDEAVRKFEAQQPE